MEQIETKVITAHVPLPLAEKVDQLAARLERSRGWIVKQALIAWIDQEEERSRLTREALADVDAGRVIDHCAVQAWADSLGTSRGKRGQTTVFSYPSNTSPDSASGALRGRPDLPGVARRPKAAAT